MKTLCRSVAIASLLFSAGSQAQETLRMATIAPSLGQAITMATFANIVTDKLDDVQIEVAAGGAATLHQLEVGLGNLDMAMTSPTIYRLMSAGKAMYAKKPEAAAAAENVRLLMLFPYGEYHFSVRGDSDISVLDDIEGATVFLGPQGGGAYNSAAGWVKATTGMVPGEDYEAITANWQTGYQAFLDGTIDMYVNGCIDPCQQFLQFTETEDVRFIEPESNDHEDVDKFLGKWRFRADVSDGLYESQTNDSPVTSFNTVVGIAVRGDLDEELVYNITKTFWENLDQVTSEAPWAKALDVKFAASESNIPLHAGAARYYDEVGAR